MLPDNKQPKLTPGLKTRKYKNREFEAFTISWLPHDFMSNPNLCVFNGTVVASFQRIITVPYRPAETLLSKKRSSSPWMKSLRWPCGDRTKSTRKGLISAVKRKRLLDGGTIKYRADDRLYRKDKVAINCFHAMAGLDELFPNGGLFGTGFKMWGFNGTARVLIEYTKKARPIKAYFLSRWM